MTKRPQQFIRVTFDIPLDKNFIPIKVADSVLSALIQINKKTELIKFEVLTDE